ncbi:hypothetical protein PV797_12465 [Clostridiaceae bacterium M8S5]|nr:hypothetical protein PV797_12465 [Clostridiaceae bacterium M8S5]
MEKLIRKMSAKQYYSFFAFYWGYYFYFYFSVGYLFCNKIWKNLSNENRSKYLLAYGLKV